MKDSVFNLSSKINGKSAINTALDPSYIFSKDVKEFIRLLKEEVFRSDCYGAGNHMCSEIDKLAGDDLIVNETFSNFKEKCELSIDGKCTGNYSPLECDGFDKPEDCKIKDEKWDKLDRKLKEFPKEADDCEEYFLDESGDFELICGKSNVYGEFHLCSKCRILPENKKFLKSQEKGK